MRADRGDQDGNIHPLTRGERDSGNRKKTLNATRSLITTSVDKHVFIVKEMKMTDCVKILGLLTAMFNEKKKLHCSLQDVKLPQQQHVHVFPHKGIAEGA